MNALLRFLSDDSWTWLRRSHVLNLSTAVFIEPERGLPVESRFPEPMVVERPMSCDAIVVGIPALLSSLPSNLDDDLHSGPVSSIFSLTTKPQLLHISSP